ncbi:sensor histidine kinase [Bacillus sp. V59.32b]|uniref:sensor histidine kinase n=1 Tax=Bacillus sp. V59.32b TaxID=1758642 RepID=UPI00135A2BF9|nr:sensor histidine kinase [Bacillus sp. V59.32b]
MKDVLRTMIKFLDSSIKRKMIVMVVVTLIFVVGMIDIVTYGVSINLQMNDAKANDARKVQFVIENIDETISNMSSLMDSISQDAEIQSMLSNSSVISVSNLEKIIFSKTSYSSNIFEHLYLYDNQKLIIKLNFNSGNKTNRNMINQTTFNKYRFDTVGRTSWRIENGVIYIDKAIRQRESLKILGYITIALKEDYMKQRLQSEEYRYTYVFNENGDVIVSSNKIAELNLDELYSRAKQEPNGIPTQLNIKPFGKMIFTTNISEFGKWRVVSLVPVKEIAKGPELIGWWIMIIGFLGILVGIIITWKGTKRLIAPLYQLKQVMDQVETGYFKQNVNIQSNDEFARLGRSFNRMMEEINHLISEVYQKELSQRESEYKALKAQINPHFLYNTLDTIRWLALYGESKKIEKVAISLAHLLKASLKESKEMIPIKTEMEYINAYLFIQQTRFEKINVSIYLDEDITNFFIPRFILQPLVENSFIHGLEKKVGNGNLIISGSVSHQSLTIRVIDNGVGMNQEEAQLLLSAKEDEHIDIAKGTGKGLKNVNKRIQALFGEEYGLSIQSSLDTGTIVEIMLPAIKHSIMTSKSI